MPILTIENAEIKTTSIEIQTLTVSGKQLTLSVFKQIQRESIFTIEPMVNFELIGNPWGKIYYVPDEGKHSKGFNIIWLKENELRRCFIYSLRSFEIYLSHEHHRCLTEQGIKNYKDFYGQMENLPQLFIAV